MKILLLAGLVSLTPFLRAESLKTTVTEPIKMELTRGKGALLLKAGTVVEVVSQDGENLGVVYRNLAGVLPVAKTDFKGEAPKTAALPVSLATTSPTKSRESVSAPESSAVSKEGEMTPAKPSPRDAPTTMYGKMVKMARDGEASHRENLVDPVSGGPESKKK